MSQYPSVPPANPQYPQTIPNSGLAITAMVLAIVSFIPLICIGPLLSIPAIILGFIALYATGRTPPQVRGRGMALIGVIVGSGNILCWIVLLVVFLAAPTFLASMIPSLGRARELANRTVDMSNIRLIVLADLSYASGNGGQFPPDIATIAAGLPGPKTLVSRSSTTTPLSTLAGASESDIEDHCDYNYVGGDLKLFDLRSPSSMIVIYEEDVHRGEGRNIGFADGHVEFVLTVALTAHFDDANRERERLGLSDLVLDGPPPAPPAPRTGPGASSSLVPPSYPTAVAPRIRVTPSAVEHTGNPTALPDSEQTNGKLDDSLAQTIATAISAKTFQDSDVIGGAFAQIPFAQVDPAGGLLIGFRYTLGTSPRRPALKFIQPIYLNASGETLGQAYGVALGDMQTIKAKAEYAVGAMDIAGGGGMDSMTITFMHIKTDRLDPNDSYTADKLGGPGGGSPRHVGGDGTPIIGICGRFKENNPTFGLGIVLLSPSPTAKAQMRPR